MEDCLYYLFTFLDDKELLTWFYVNHLFNKISHANVLWQKRCRWIQCQHDFFHHFKTGYILYGFLSKQITCYQPFNTLKTLDLSYKNLTSIPPELGQCAALQFLDLSYNQLTSVPPELGQCATLQYLYLNNNQLTSIPPEIGQYAALQRLKLQ